jgi:hypothetical protein
MTPNELLLWLSARKAGSWSQFRGAVETLDLANSSIDEEQDGSLPIHQRVRLNLERLAHLEFDAADCENGWRVVPPALSLTQNRMGVIGVLCGARTVELLEKITRAARGFVFERFPETDCPDIIRIHAPESKPLIEIARNEGIQCQPDAPSALLSNLPAIDASRAWPRTSLPAAGKDWDVKQFVLEKRSVKWRQTTLLEANSRDAQGLFCFTRFQMPQYFLRQSDKTVRIPGAIGKYLVLSHRRRRVLRYDRNRLRLTLPAILRPPLLTERALVLCSGFPPILTLSYKRPMLTYRDVPEEVAGMTAEILRQELS